MKRIIVLLAVLVGACGLPDYAADNEIDDIGADRRGLTQEAGTIEMGGACCLEGTAVETVSALEPPVYGDTWSTAPSDGTEVKAAGVREAAQLALTNDAYILLRRYTWSYSIEEPAFTFVIFSTTSYDVPGSGGYVEIPDAQVGDVIDVRLSCTLENANVAASGNGNRLRLAAIDDYGGGGETSPAEVPGARLYINTPIGQLTPAFLEGHWEVTVAGTTRIQIEGRVDTGAGQQLIIQSAAYLRAEHSRAPIDGVTP